MVASNVSFLVTQNLHLSSRVERANHAASHGSGIGP